MSSVIERTKEHIKNRQRMTYKELVEDWEENDTYDMLYDDDDGGGDNRRADKDNNPLKLPIGFDGKPIPYWLYKLHGLGKQFNCEICGNYTYNGRRVFKRHFKEERHQHGMRCLGITNSNSFNKITQIAEAKSLLENIRHKQETSEWQPDVDKEFEDDQGNIYNKKTYSDLKSTLPEDEWFSVSETAKAAINKLLLGASGSEVSEAEEEPIFVNHHLDMASDSDDSISCPSTVDSFHSFVSAETGDTESPSHFSDHEG